MWGVDLIPSLPWGWSLSWSAAHAASAGVTQTRPRLRSREPRYAWCTLLKPQAARMNAHRPDPAAVLMPVVAIDSLRLEVKWWISAPPRPSSVRADSRAEVREEVRRAACCDSTALYRER